ncbi:MAG TPA: helix-turn-helix domain-containing protein [Candidatus Dormibacteraeota bacterium]|nr:helix-turn-helix domain-containing protein [Candidatus Dormibacteraeota bacterium]
MSPRGYRLGRRQSEIERTRSAILLAARELVSEHGPASSMGKVAERAGVSRITVYNQFGSKERLLEALAAGIGPRSGEAPAGAPSAGPRDELLRRIGEACTAWAADPSLYRRLEPHHRWKGEESNHDRALAEKLAAHDQLRPGCSVKEAEDVIGILTSFAVFDRLHKGGRRSTSAVAEILMRMAREFLA